MATKKPAVVSSGLVEQVQVSDVIALQGYVYVRLVNDNAGSVVIGAPVYITANDHFDKARANVAATREVIGFVIDTSIASAATGNVATDGNIIATTTEWDAITGGTGGLIAGSVYYLDAATAGKMTLTPPSTAGQYICRLGKAISTTKFHIEVQAPLKK